jgi:hypothetical protein
MAKVTKLQAAIDRIQGDIDILEAAKSRLMAEVDRTAKKVVNKAAKPLKALAGALAERDQIGRAV